MLAPKRILHRKVQRGLRRARPRVIPSCISASLVSSLEAHWITNRQIEAAFRIAMTRYMKRGGRVYITIFPDKPINKKPAETRMGSAGNPRGVGGRRQARPHHVRGQGRARGGHCEALRLAQHKLPIKTKIVAAKNAEQRIEKEMAEEAALEAKWAARGRRRRQGGELMKPADSSSRTLSSLRS